MHGNHRLSTQLAIYVRICVSLTNLICVKFTVAAQAEGPGEVIVHPGQDVVLFCAVNEISQDLTEGWLVNKSGPYGINAIRHGRDIAGLVGQYNATSNLEIGDLIVENITMNDNRNGTEYVCVTYKVPLEEQGPPTADDIRNRSDPTFLYVAGE